MTGPVLYIASYDSRHFCFEGCGSTEADALAQCIRALDAHTRMRDCEPGWWHEGHNREDAVKAGLFGVRCFRAGDAFIDQWPVPAGDGRAGA